MRTFITADMHLGHSNIIRLCNRPFKTLEEMDETLIYNFNNKVKKDDVCYILGDVVFRNTKSIDSYLSRLNGHKILITGNHDKKIVSQGKKYFDRIIPSFDTNVASILRTDIDGHYCVLSHYPLVEWDGYFRGAYHIFGHIHNNITNRAYEIISNEPNAFNAGVDINNYEPVLLDELIENNKKFYNRK